MPRSRDYITNLAATGRYHFTVDEMAKALGISRNAAALALNRLSKQRPAGKWETGNASSVFLETYLHVVNFLGREAAHRKPVDWQMYAPRSASGWKRPSDVNRVTRAFAAFSAVILAAPNFSALRGLGSRGDPQNRLGSVRLR
jgi:hypothetical protein